jgi:transposase
LNPIEHAWSRLKEMIYQIDPDIESFRGTEKELRKQLAELIEEAWELIDQEYFDRLVDSMPRRIEAGIAAGGWHTEY